MKNFSYLMGETFLYFPIIYQNFKQSLFPIRLWGQVCVTADFESMLSLSLSGPFDIESEYWTCDI